MCGMGTRRSLLLCLLLLATSIAPLTAGASGCPAQPIVDGTAWRYATTDSGSYSGYPKCGYHDTDRHPEMEPTDGQAFYLDTPGGAAGYIERTVEIPEDSPWFEVTVWGHRDPVTITVSVDGGELHSFTTEDALTAEGDTEKVEMAYDLNYWAGEKVTVRVSQTSSGNTGTIADYDVLRFGGIEAVGGNETDPAPQSNESSTLLDGANSTQSPSEETPTAAEREPDAGRGVKARPETRIGKALDEHRDLAGNAADYADLASDFENVTEPPRKALERVLEVRAFLQQQEAYGATAWDAATTASPSLASLFDMIEEAERTLETTEANMERLQATARNVEEAIEAYRQNASAAHEEEVRVAFNAAIPAYTAAAGDLRAVARVFDDAASAVDTIEADLDQHRDKPFVGSYIGDAADRVGAVGDELASTADDLREPASSMENDAETMSRAVAEPAGRSWVLYGVGGGVLVAVAGGGFYWVRKRRRQNRGW